MSNVINARDVRLFDYAMRIAAQSLHNQKHGVVIAQGDRILVTANNALKTHPAHVRLIGRSLLSVHAEHNAIRKCGGADLSAATLYSAKYNGFLRSKPCKMCRVMIIKAKIRYVVFHDGITLRKEWIGSGYE